MTTSVIMETHCLTHLWCTAALLCLVRGYSTPPPPKKKKGQNTFEMASLLSLWSGYGLQAGLT